MSRALRHVFIALALLVTQHAAQMHALSHLSHDLAVAAHGEKNAPPLGHSIEKCVAFHGLGSVISNGSVAPWAACVAQQTVAQFVLPLPLPQRIVFDSRAPPALS